MVMTRQPKTVKSESSHINPDTLFLQIKQVQTNIHLRFDLSAVLFPSGFLIATLKARSSPL